MATAQIRLYQCDITPDKNCRIDSLATYLANCTTTTGDITIQYQKIALDLEVKLTLDQSQVGDANYNYCRINEDSKNYYFFIKKATWTAASCVRLILVLDTINTYWSDLSWNRKTAIKRQHCDRFKLLTTGTYARVIDRFAENLQPVMQYQALDQQLYGTGVYSGHSYVVYSQRPISADSTITARPVQALFFTDDDSDLYIDTAHSYSATTQTINLPTDSNNVRYMYWITLSNNPVAAGSTAGTKITIGSNTYTLGSIGATTDDKIGRLCAVGIRRTADGSANVYLRYYSWSGQAGQNTGISYPYTYMFSDDETATGTSNKFTITNSRFVYLYYYTDTNSQLTDLEEIDNNYLSRVSAQAGSVIAVKQAHYSEVDTANPRFTKIVELPTLPDNAGGSSVDNIDWGYRCYKRIVFSGSQWSTGLLPSTYIGQRLVMSFTPAEKQTYNFERESKLYSSEFYDPEIVYDNVSSQIKLENLTGYGTNLTLNTTIYASADMTSNKLIHWDFTSDSACVYNKETNFEDYLVATRSTERPIYNSAWADYLKTGYNYDQEAAKAQQRNSVVNTVVGMIGAATNLGASLVSGTSGFGGLMAGKAVSAVGSAIQTAQSIEDSKRNFAASLAQKSQSSVNTTGSGSADLQDLYGGGDVRLIVRQPIGAIRKNIADTFYYTGYAHPVNDIPDFTSRIYFNYVQCSPVFDDEATSVYSAYLDDIKYRFEQGITVYHRYNGYWDLTETYENWETSIM